MSDELPERDEIIRSTVITVILTAILLIVSLAFWAWSAEEVIASSPVGALNAMNPFLAPLIEILAMFGVFVFLTVTAVNLRLFLTRLRSGWFEIILLVIIVTIMTYLMFGTNVAAVETLLSLAFVVYLYLLQE
ncbi:MAG: hypothetical protein ACFFAY_07910 [Promethearchaeota archaeon]